MNRVLLAVSLFALIGSSAAAAPKSQAQKPPAKAAATPMDHGAMGHGAMTQGEPMSDAALIQSATSAAPPAVGRTATVIDVGKDGTVRTVRKGTGGFTCMADNPTTPGPDPMCMDANALEWANAWLKKQAPPAKVGFMYMLEGGTDASNTDPYATAPSAGNHWVKTGPHVMVVGAPDLLRSYPTSPDPDTAQPYVMWAGTPYAHLMIPVR